MLDKTIDEPLLMNGECAQQLRFQFALRPFEHQRVVDFAARLENARDARNQVARTDRARIRCVFCMQINRQPAIDTWRAVPNQRVEIFAHRMVGIVTRHCLDRAADIALRCRDVLVLEPDACLGFVLIGQRHILQLSTPTAAACE